jgi:AcrR family transcriptional regulator
MPRYSSPLREAQAAQTRARILESAVEAFGQHGWSGASLAKIAAAAGVSVETVKLIGGKPALLLAAFDHAFAGRELDGPIHTNPEGAALLDASDADLLPGLVRFVASGNARVALLWPRLLEAAAADDDVAARVAALQASRLADMRAAIAGFRERGLCASTRPDDELADALSYLIAPEGYVRLVRERGWTESAYRDWVVRAVERVVFTD